MEYKEFLRILEAYLKRNKCLILNRQRCIFIMEMYKELKKLIEDKAKETTIEIVKGPLDLGDLTIRIKTPQFTAYDPKTLAETIKKADNISIYPTTDDRIKLDFQFYNMFDITLL